MKKFKGFTLAEILIAMTVLGIIVAASVPVILNMRPNRNAIMMKKAYYATETIISSLINDSKYYPDTGVAATEGFKNTDTTGITVEGAASPIASSHKMKCLFASKLNIKESIANVCAGTTTTITTMDGMSWDLSGLPESGATNGYVRIDVDGPNKGINTFFVEGASGCTAGAEYSWTGSAPCGSGTDKARKEFDSIVIKIEYTGKLNIEGSDKQTELFNILSGQTKLFRGDKD